MAVHPFCTAPERPGAFAAVRRLAGHAVTLAVALCVALTLNGPPAAQETLRIAAVVNDEVISVHDLASRIDLLIATSNMVPGQETRQRLAGHVLRLLIEERLKLQEARRLNIAVSREELEGALEQIASQVGVRPDQLAEMLASRGTDIQDLITQVEAEIAWIKTVQARTGGEITVTDDEIDARLQFLRSQKGKPEVRFAEIFLPLGGATPEAEIQGLAQRLILQLAEGASFRSLARNFSQGPTAAAGGDLGWMGLDQVDPELRETVAQLEPGKAFGPVRTSVGYYILYMIDRRVVSAPEDEAEVVRLFRVSLPLPPGAEEARIRAGIQRIVQIASGTGDCGALGAAAAQAGNVISGDLGTIEVSRLDPQLQRIIEPLGVGEKTPPLAAEDGVTVFMVCERGRQDISEQIRQRVREILLQERLAAASRRLLRDLQREAFVDVRI